jgi:exopolysaccharide biosynthesis polyprenyl glycosylphosphotransferase
MRNPTAELAENRVLLAFPEAVPSVGASARRYRSIGLGVAATDMAAICLALTVAYWMRYGIRPLPMRELLLVAAAPVVWVLVFQAFSLYNLLHLPPADEFRRTVGATGVGLVLLVMVSFWSKASFSRIWVALTWIMALLLELLARRAWRIYLHRRRLDGRLTLRTLIIGSTGEAVQLAKSLGVAGSGFQPLGYVEPAGPAPVEDTLPVLGRIEQLRELINQQEVDCLFVASTVVAPETVELVARAARQQGVHVLVSSNMSQVLSSRLSPHQIGSVVALALRPVRLTGTQAVAKRAFDMIAGSLLLLVTLPLSLAAAIVIRLTSPGPVFFHQERVTRGGRTFRMHKFRTMTVGGPADASETVGGPADASELDTSVPFFKLDQDPRITRVGHLLRKWSLDELPQLWNVICGEMSLVGPRPLPTEQVATNLQLLGPRHEVPAGMTGWWQINGRSDVVPEEAVRLDTFYIENWSLTFDLYILLKTLSTVLERKGAY